MHKTRARQIPIDFVLNRWIAGANPKQIARELGRVDGMPFQPLSILAAIARARKAGDPRAVLADDPKRKRHP